MDRRKKITREDGTRWAYGYNDKGEVTAGTRELKASPNTAVPGWNHAYSFDKIGNRLTATTNSRVSTYTPNALNQYEDRTIPRAFDVIGKANTAATVTVDSNATTRLDEYFYKKLSAGSGAVHVLYSVQATDGSGTTTRNGGKFLPSTPETFTYDSDGNLTSDGRFTLTWDAENRLIGMETHSSIPLPARRKLTFDYDAMGRRVRKTVWHGTTGGGWQLHHKFDFIHELGGWNILAERSSDSLNTFLRTYTWGTDLSGNRSGAGGVGGLLFATLHTSGKAFAYGSDLNGNVTLLISLSDGQPAATFDYGPFGEPLRQSGEYATLNPYRFSTKYTDDETGFIDYGHRYYIPSLGRWPSRDLIAENGGMNLYGFVGNNAIQAIDLFGFCSTKCIGKVEVKFTRSYILNQNNPSWKVVNGVNVLDDPDHYRVSGRQFSGYMNVFDECGNLMEAFDVVSGGHREPGRPPGHDTSTPSGKYTFESKLKGSVPGYTVDNVPGRSYIQIHRSGTTTGCIATQYFSEQFVPLVEATRKDENCCKNKMKISIEVWYGMEDGSGEPIGNTFNSGDGNDPGHKPDPSINVVPPPVPPRAIIVQDPNNPRRHPWWPF